MSEQNAAQNGGIPMMPGELPQMDDEQVLAFTRGVRIKVVQDLFKGGAVSGENSDRIMLGQMLAGLDSQAINNKRLQLEQKNSDTASNMVAELLRTIDKNKIFTGTQSDRDVIDVEMRQVPMSIGDVAPVPGEMDVAPPQLDYAGFVRSQGGDIDQMGKEVQHPEAEDDEDF